MHLNGDRPPDDSMAQARYREMIDEPKWREPEGYTWHHSERVGIMQLVPTAIHDAFKHTGAIPLWRVLTGEYSSYAKE